MQRWLGDELLLWAAVLVPVLYPIVTALPNGLKRSGAKRGLSRVFEEGRLAVGFAIATTLFSTSRFVPLFAPPTILAFFLIPVLLNKQSSPTETKTKTSSLFERPTSASSNDGPLDTLNSEIATRRWKISRIDCLDHIRAATCMLTVVAIWAVNFPIYPMEFKKNKNIGLSIMDIGTGCIVYVGGISRALMLMRQTGKEQRSSASRKLSSTSREVTSTPSSLVNRQNLARFVRRQVNDAFGLFVLGMIRAVTVVVFKVGYDRTEYGYDWNFFFTLSFTYVLATVVHVFSSFFSPKLLLSLRPLTVDALAGLLLMVVQSVILSLPKSHQDLRVHACKDQSVYDWAMTENLECNPRVTLLQRNAEGVLSVLGYTALLLLSFESAAPLLRLHQEQSTPHTTRQPQNQPHVQHHVQDTFLLRAVVAHSAYYLLRFAAPSAPSEADALSGGGLVSHVEEGMRSGVNGSRQFLYLPVRRIANASYVLFAFGCMQISADLVFRAQRYFAEAAARHPNPIARPLTVPWVSKFVSQHLLLVFIVANVVTGVVDKFLAFHSRAETSPVAHVLLHTVPRLTITVYALAVVGLSWLVTFVLASDFHRLSLRRPLRFRSRSTTEAGKAMIAKA